MNNLEKEVRQMSAMDLALEYDRLLFLAEYDDPPSISLVAAKKLLYVEEALKDRLYELLPGLPRLESKKSKESKEPEDANYMNVILESYYERKSKLKIEPEVHLRFFVKVKNSLNTTIASIPVTAPSKGEAIEIARKKSIKYGKNLTFKVC